MGEFIDLSTDKLVAMIAKGIEEKRQRSRNRYDPEYQQAYYLLNKERICQNKKDLRKYYSDLETAYDKIVAENTKLRERNKLLELIVKGLPH